MATLSDLTQQVKERVYNCPNVIIEESLNRAVRNFARETHAHTRSGTITLPAGQDEFTIVPPGDSNIVAWRMLINTRTGKEITFVSSPYWKEVTSGSDPTLAHTADFSTIEFNAQPETDLAMKYEYALMPTYTATTVADIFVDQYGDFIAHGAQSYLLSTAGRDWYDPGSAQVALSYYREGIAMAKGIHLHTRSTASRRVFQNRFI